MKKAAKIFGWIVLVVVLVLGLVLALSPVAKYVINNYGERIVGRQLHADRVVINPYWGGVTIRGFQCKEPNGETDFVSFDHLYVQIAWPQLMGKRVILRHIHLDGFNGQVLKSGEKVNFSDIIERFSSKDTLEQEVPKDTTKARWIVSLKDIRLRNSTVRYRDVVGDKQWSLEDISLSIPGLYFDNTQTNAGMEFGLPTGGRVGIVAGMKMQANRYAVLINLYDVNTDVVLPLVQDYLEISGLGAKINGQVHVDGSLENIMNIQLKGNLSMAGLSLRDNDDDEVAALDELRLAIAKGDLLTNTYLLDTLSITGLTGNYEVHEKWNSLTRLMKKQKPAEEEEAEKNTEYRVQNTDSRVQNTESGVQNTEDGVQNTEKAKQSKPLVWMAKNVVLTGHDLTYEDYSMKHNWEYAIETLRVEGKNVASNGRNILQAKATLTNDAKLNMDYVGSLNMKQGDSRLNLKLTGVQLTDFNALCRNYTGYPLESGILSLESHMNVTAGKLAGTNTIVIDQPKVGKRERLSKAPYKNIPVRAGFNLLTSAQNMIVLNVPVTGDVSNPKFKLSKVIGRAILKVFFGPLMGMNDRGKTISDEELREMQELFGDDTLSETTTDVAMAAGDSVGLAEVGQ